MISIADRSLTIRRARDDDASAIRRLAELDSARLPAGPLLLGEVDGELRAAMTLDGRTVIADPFQSTQELVELLEVSRRESGRHQRHRAHGLALPGRRHGTHPLGRTHRPATT